MILKYKKENKFSNLFSQQVKTKIFYIYIYEYNLQDPRYKKKTLKQQKEQQNQM